ncbi:MAG: hypothetical protein C5B55_12155 [Blastocatellia bacterium]|nr:MAG: hypothetical protein C5B55_12155 [Blastocatellia bacterium]
MDLHSIFINTDGRLRSGWRLLLYAFLFLAIYILLGTGLWIMSGVLGPFIEHLPHVTFVRDVVGRLVMLTSAIAAGYLCNRFLEGLPWRALGLTLHTGWLRDFIVGSVIGLVSLFIAVGLATIGRGLRFSFNGNGVLIVVESLASTIVLFVVAAVAEEAIFRGYALQTLTRAQLALVGILLTSVPFSIGHLWNPNVVPVVTFVNTALAGVWLSLAYLRTRSLWFPLGIHWAWNWALNSVCGLPVSGLKVTSNPLFHGTDLGPSWLTGGSYGIEGGAAAFIALILSTLFVWKTSLVQPTPEMFDLTSHENPAVPKAEISIRQTERQV